MDKINIRTVNESFLQLTFIHCSVLSVSQAVLNEISLYQLGILHSHLLLFMRAIFLILKQKIFRWICFQRLFTEK